MNMISHSLFASSALTKYSFGDLSRITISNPEPRHYVQKSRDGHVMVLTPVSCDETLTPLANGPSEIFMQAEIGELLKDRKIEVEPHFFDPARKELVAWNPAADCARDLPEGEFAYLDFNHQLVGEVEWLRETKGSSLTDAALKPVLKEAYATLVARSVSEEHASEAGGGESNYRIGQGKRISTYVPKLISPSTYRSYRRKLLETRDDLIALRDGRTAAATLRPHRIDDPVVNEILTFWTRAYLDRSGPTVSSLYKLMAGEFLALNDERLANCQPAVSVPSESTLRRRVKDLNPYEKVLAREGVAAARRKFKIAARHDAGIAPGDRVQMDNWRTNVGGMKLPTEFWAGMPEEWQGRIAKLRFNLCLAIDEASRVVLGVRLSLNPAAEVSIKTLELTARDKSAIAQGAGCVSTWDHCLSTLCVATDGGSEFRGEFRATVRDHGATIDVGPAGKPDVRAIVERAFGTIDSQLMQHFVGRTGKNVADKGDFDHEAMANVTVEVLTKCLVRYIVDVYHNQRHSSLGGETPNDAWARLNDLHGVLPPPSPERMRAIFGHRDERAISNRGIRFLGMHFRSRELAVLRKSVGQAKLNIRVDLCDLGHIAVQDLKGRWLTVPNELEGFDGVTAMEWIATAEALRRKYAKNAKLREPIVLKALAAIRKEGLAAAERAGIGPTILSSDMVTAHERELFTSFDITLATQRGRALEGLDDVDAENAAESDRVEADAGSALDGAPKRPSPTRRRRGAGADFLAED